MANIILQKEKELIKYQEQLIAAPIFSGLKTEEIFSLVLPGGADIMRVNSGTILFNPGDFERRLGIILSGSAKVEKPAEGQDIMVSILTPGQILGAAFIFSEEDCITRITANENSVILFISKERLSFMLKEDFRLAENLFSYFSRRIRFLTDRVESISRLSAADKLLHHLRQNAIGDTVCLPYSMSALASALGMGRASLYRVIVDLEDQGYLRRDGKTIKLLK